MSPARSRAQDGVLRDLHWLLLRGIAFAAELAGFAGVALKFAR